MTANSSKGRVLMKHLHTRTRRLVATVLFVSAVGLAATLAVSALSTNARGASSAGNTVSFYKQGKLLGTKTIAAGTSLDVVWKATSCSNGFTSPPVAFTWNNASTGATSAPVMGPCLNARGVLDVACSPTNYFPYSVCYFTFGSNGSGIVERQIANPGGGNIGTVYLYKRTALYAYVMTPGQPNKKISVPAGANVIQFTGAG
jgi:hypothetical protein